MTNMVQRNNGARRRKAFADFRENQYNDSFSVSNRQKRKNTINGILKYVIIILVTVFFICVGFVLSDALIDISNSEYKDTKTYLPNTTISSSEPQ